MTEQTPEFALVSNMPTEDVGDTKIDVRISFQIIRLFSEGLYQSPHKAIEELVSNSFDAGAHRVDVLLPRSGEDAPHLEDSLWVVDDGFGMDAAGFEALWRVADSAKYQAMPEDGGRAPIGQFGIGKLAAYVLAWRLTHVSCVAGRYRFTSMDFHIVEGKSQYGDADPKVQLTLHEVSEAEAKRLLAELEERAPDVWPLPFGPEAKESWTADYRQTRHVCTVEAAEESEGVLYALEDGKEFKSPSAAGSAVMGGTACNGWRFWSVEGEESPAREAKPATKKGGSKGGRKRRSTRNTNTKLIYAMPDQSGVPEGMARFWCNACMDSFEAEDGKLPEECPEGHRADDEELTVPAGVTAEAEAEMTA